MTVARRLALASLLLAVSDIPANAMMQPSVYDDAIMKAAGRAVLGDLSISFDGEALECTVGGAVLRTMAGIGDFPRFDESRPPPPVPNPGAPLDRPAPGETMLLTIPCIAEDSTDISIGGNLYQKYERLLHAAEIMILIDGAGGFHPAHSAGFRITATKKDE